VLDELRAGAELVDSEPFREVERILKEIERFAPKAAAANDQADMESATGDRATGFGRAQ
jgi:hypothetical protein